MNFIKKFLLNIYNWILEENDKLYPYLHQSPKVKGIIETLEYIRDHKCSVVRYGDGEFKLMFGIKTAFQHVDVRLSKNLSKILKSKNSSIIICIQPMFKSLSKYKEDEQQYWRNYNILNRKKNLSQLDLSKTYYDSFISRCYMPYKDKSIADKCFILWKQIWNSKDLLIIEGEKTRLGVGNDLFNNAKSIQRILCPNENAFDYYDQLLKTAQKFSKNYLILLAVGPTATVLAYELGKLGYWAIDIGHLDIEYEWYLSKVESKVPVYNKYVNEAGGGHNIGEELDEKYLKEIMYKIGV
ncbi:MAG: SP_1767 family glycosyltransferase [Phocaeicola sp.]|uniref:SP_1767 family glycosyltransferase n=1 Tax=Phocaeicola sp. TaxID=2773926 RepID=UPI003FA0E5D8